ncbi:MAG: hypothetical protein AAFO94_10710 [Bacteroidota bacterium]
MRKRLIAFAVLVAAFNLVGCVKDIGDIKIDGWEPEVAIPILNSTIVVEDLLDDFETGGSIERDENDFLTLVYEDEVFSQRGDEIINIPDFSIPMFTDEQSVPTNNLPFNFQLNKVILKGGNFNYNLQSNLPEDAQVTIQIPNFKKGDEMLEMDMMVASATTMNNNFDLTGYELDLTDDLLLRYEAYYMDGTEKQRLDNVNFAFSDLEYSYIEGEFGQYDFDLPAEQLVLDMFSEATGGSIYFEDPTIELTFNNSFGVPISLRAETMLAQTHKEGEQNVITPLNAGVSFNYPMLSEVGQFKTTTLTLNKSTTNIADIIAANPYQIDYEFAAVTNPDDDSFVGFAEDDSYFSVNVDVALPLWFRASDLLYETTQEFSINDMENLESLEFKLITENGLPLDVNIQVLFEDANGTVLATLLEEETKLIEGASVDDDGRVIANGEHTEIILLDRQKMEDLKLATQVRLLATLSTSNDGNDSVRIYANQDVRFKLGAKAILSETE